MASGDFRLKRLIRRKRDGEEIAAADWRRFVDALVAGELPDYQVAALLMAVYFRGLTTAETAALTSAMASSGERLSLTEGPYVDKHSTGGVGDKVTLVAVPWAAACGARIAKLSGRGLGHTGGTVDKLASIPGLNLALSARELKALADEVGWAVAEARNVAPADKILYALRDATATVESTPLIVASILSKKIAGGAPAFVFDVKAGSGGLAGDETAARALAEELVAAAKAAGRKAVALITAMDQPLGRAVGNALEVAEAAAALSGEAPDDLVEVSRAVAAEMVILSGAVKPEAVEARLGETLESGAAFAKLDAMVRAQGAPEDWLEKLPRAANAAAVVAAESGYIASLDAYGVAAAANALGVGRASVEADIDPAAGIVLHRKRGDAVRKGDALMTLHYDDGRLAGALTYAREAVVTGEDPVPPRPTVIDVVR
jgi:pyrimidine-nucleoside phosphorylase